MNKPQLKQKTKKKYDYLFGTKVKTFQQLKELYPQEMFQPQQEQEKKEKVA